MAIVKNNEAASILLFSQTVVSDLTYSVINSDALILVDTNAGAITLTLPSDAHNGQWFLIKDIANQATSNPITIDTAGSELIDGNASIVLDNDGDSAQLNFDGSNYNTILKRD